MLNIVEPESLGLNRAQLARVGEHLRARYVDAGKIPGSLALVARRGEVCYLDVAGHSDVERGTPLAADSIFRIYSMSKPITSAAIPAGRICRSSPPAASARQFTGESALGWVLPTR